MRPINGDCTKRGDRSCWWLALVVAWVWWGVMPVRGADWFRWRGPTADGISPETEWTSDWPAGGPPVMWRTSVGTGLSAVTVSRGRLYTMGNTDNVDSVVCLDSESGREVWRHTYDSPLDARFFEGGPTATPTVDDGHVYSLGREGQLFCLQAATGEVIWAANLRELSGARLPGWGFGGSPVVFGDRLLLNVGDAGMALNKVTGELIWKSGDGQAGYTTPVLQVDDKKAIMYLASAKFYSAVNVMTGDVLWQHRWLTRFGANAADPLLSGNRLFISSGYNRGCALLDLQGAVPGVVWSHKAMQNQFSSSVLLDGYVYGIDGDTGAARTLKCLELATGEVTWSFEGLGSGALIAAGQRLIILSEEGELVVAAASPKSFKEIARAKVLKGRCWTMPTLANGRVICRSDDGEVVSVDVRQET